MDNLTGNIVKGQLVLTYQGRAYRFASTTNIDQANPVVWGRRMDMQSKKYINFKTNTQQPKTADITASNVAVDEFNMLKAIYEAGEIVTLSFIFDDGSAINYVEPNLANQPLRASINDSETTFDVKLTFNCSAIE